jgi:hypothetical protein
MFFPKATAECSLYQSTQHYRTSLGGMRASARQSRSGQCFDNCMRQCSSEGGFPMECSVQCNQHCRGPIYEYCTPGNKECFRTGMRPHCCPDSATCCRFRDRVTLRDKLECCGPGKVCCDNIYSGCYDPAVEQCTASGIWPCPTGRAFCQGVCCETGDICTAQGCCPPAGCPTETPTCETDIQCTDPSYIAVGTWPACGCVPANDSDNSSDTDPPSNGFDGFHPGPGGVDTCEQFFECPPRYEMAVENDVCVCK